MIVAEAIPFLFYATGRACLPTITVNLFDFLFKHMIQYLTLSYFLGSQHRYCVFSLIII